VLFINYKSESTQSAINLASPGALGAMLLPSISQKWLLLFTCQPEIDHVIHVLGQQSLAPVNLLIGLHGQHAFNDRGNQLAPLEQVLCSQSLGHPPALEFSAHFPLRVDVLVDWHEIQDSCHPLKECMCFTHILWI
jgi:hypothetical protein